MKIRQWATEYGIAVGLTVFFAIVLGQLPIRRWCDSANSEPLILSNFLVMEERSRWPG